MKRIKHLIQKIKLDDVRLRNKFLVLFSFCVLIPIVLTNIIFYNLINNNVQEQRYNDIHNAVEQIKSDMWIEIEEAFSVAYVLYNEYYIYNLLDSDYDQDSEFVDAYDRYFRRLLTIYQPVY